MLDSGNFVLYDSIGNIVWQTFDQPSDTIIPGQRLRNQQRLVSSSGKFCLSMQMDGNLVQYPVRASDTSQDAYWATNTDGLGNTVTLNLDSDSRLYLSSLNGAVQSITMGGNPREGNLYRAKLDDEGILRLYRYDLNKNKRWSTKWSSVTDNCDPKGWCGHNSFCTNEADNHVECVCLTGYKFVDSGNRSMGCERNFTIGNCDVKERKLETQFEMEELFNTDWEDDPYEVVTRSKEDCRKSCLEDCSCEVALFNKEEEKCKKQKLPMIYGKRHIDSTVVALIKVGLSSYINVSPNNASQDNRSLSISLTKRNKERIYMKVLIIGIPLISLTFIVMVIAMILMFKGHVRAYKKFIKTRDVELCEGIAPRSFTYEELVEITNDFNEEVGRGAFGTVYKGKLIGNQRAVAVKKLEHMSVEGEREFQNEMRVIGKTHHRNLVRLIGYCSDGHKRLLMYEYMSHGSLASALFTPQKHPDWEQRTRIALDIAKGILYLHEECETQIIHCDIKPQNILMDDQGCTKISDFGLSKLLKADQTKTDTGVRGTRGYVAPEWHRKMPISVKADVYSFGIVLLEIICCRKNVDWSLPGSEAILEEWVYDCFLRGELNKLIKEEDDVEKKKVEKFVKIAVWCIQDDPSLRPSIKKVLLMLEGTVEIPIPPSPTSFMSTM